MRYLLTNPEEVRWDYSHINEISRNYSVRNRINFNACGPEEYLAKLIITVCISADKMADVTEIYHFRHYGSMTFHPREVMAQLSKIFSVISQQEDTVILKYTTILQYILEGKE